MNARKKAMALCMAACSLCLFGQVSAGVIYSEDFNSMTVGDGLNDSGTNWNGNAGDYTVVAGGSIFTDQHLELTAPDANFNFANRDQGSNPVLTFSIDLVDLGTSTSADAEVRLAIRRATGSANTSVVMMAPTAAGTPDNTVVHYDLVINTSASPVLYQDGVTSIAANTMEFWVDGVLKTSTVAAGTGDAVGIGLWNRRPDNAFIADNIVVHDMAVFAPPVPEPTSFALLSILGVMMIFRRRSA